MSPRKTPPLRAARDVLADSFREKYPFMAANDDYRAWRATLVVNTLDCCPQITAPMPPIRCTMPVPCGHCAFCKVAKYGPEWWLR